MHRVRLTVERDSAMLPTTTNDDSNNDNSKNSSIGAGDDAASAAADGCSLQIDTSVNDDLGDVNQSPSPSITRNVKRRSTIPKTFVTPSLSVFLSVSLRLSQVGLGSHGLQACMRLAVTKPGFSFFCIYCICRFLLSC